MQQFCNIGKIFGAQPFKCYKTVGLSKIAIKYFNSAIKTFRSFAQVDQGPKNLSPKGMVEYRKNQTYIL